MKRKTVLSITITLIVLISTIAAISYITFSKNSISKPVHVGVTYGGGNSADAKALIDKVKDYTNLFVITSVSGNFDWREVCDYAVGAGLDVMLYFGSDERYRSTYVGSIKNATERYGSHFLGVYYGDEPGGKWLDKELYYTNLPDIGNVSKTSGGFIISQKNGSLQTSKTFGASGHITLSYSDSLGGNNTFYNTDGTITFGKLSVDNAGYEELTYYPNGTVTLVTIQAESMTNPVIVTNRGSISQFEPYQKVWESRSFQTYNETIAAIVAEKYVNGKIGYDVGWLHDEFDVNVMTSDYALYWWDYQGGYDTIFAQLGWNNTVAQEIGLVRGAANLQGKSWGTILTWKYTHAPYLTDGAEMFDQMKTSYEAGADYVIVFNYAEDTSGPYGTLKEEHFQALERFWNEAVKNSNVVHGSAKAEVALVLPKDFGWGMRSQYDWIWGLWNANSTSTSAQIWTQLQSLLSQYGSKLDIVYDDPAYPVAGKYGQILYWNQTS